MQRTSLVAYPYDRPLKRVSRVSANEKSIIYLSTTTQASEPIMRCYTKGYAGDVDV